MDIAGATNATLNLATAGNGDAGDQISVRVTGHDGFSLSAPVTSSAVTIVNPNTAPTADVSLNDTAPRTNDTITATAVGSDGQNDPLTYTYVWKVEGVTRQTTSNVASTTDTFDLSASNHGNRGENVTVTVTANDGSLTSTPTASSTATATVANTPPVVDSVTIDQSSPNTDDVLSATITSSDADGDSRTYSYQWLKNGNPISGETNATLDLGVAGNGSSGDQLSLRVGANDGTDDSTLVTSSAVTVGNAAPVVDSVTIDQSVARHRRCAERHGRRERRRRRHAHLRLPVDEWRRGHLRRNRCHARPGRFGQRRPRRRHRGSCHRFGRWFDLGRGDLRTR